MKHIKKGNIISFALGSISTIIIVFIVLFIINHFDNKTNIRTNRNDESKEYLVIDNEKYILDKYGSTTLDNELKCDAFKDMWFAYGKAFITYEGDLYQYSDKLFTETNQNCKLYSDKYKIKSIISGTFVTKDNRLIHLNPGNEFGVYDEGTVESIDDYYDTKDVYNGYKIVANGKHTDENTRIEYIALKNNGNIYSLKYSRNYVNFTAKYSLLSEDLIMELKEERVKTFNINPDEEYGYILTDKNIYVKKYITNECKEYVDKQCQYEFFKIEEIDKYIDNILFFGIDGDGESITIKTTNGNYIFNKKH